MCVNVCVWEEVKVCVKPQESSYVQFVRVGVDGEREVLPSEETFPVRQSRDKERK